MPRFAKIAWAALAYNLLVIAWGAYVRASGSGAGCGAHWPLCNGEVLPRSPALKTVVEFSHRASSGVVLVVAVALVIFAFRSYEKGAPVRRSTLFVLGFTLVEALIGAALVLFELVARDTSMKRALSMVMHLGNTFFLLAALTLTAHLAVPGPAPAEPTPAPQSSRSWTLRALLVVSAAGTILVGMSGGIAALGDTLFPATSFAQGLAQELSTGAHVLLRLRVLHPLFAIAVAGLLVVTSAVARAIRPDPGVVRWSRAVSMLVVVQLGLGILNVALLAPIWLQLVHLLVADLTWIAFVMLWAHARALQGSYERNTTRLRPARLAS
jgi:heme A synthase